MKLGNLLPQILALFDFCPQRLLEFVDPLLSIRLELLHLLGQKFNVLMLLDYRGFQLLFPVRFRALFLPQGLLNQSLFFGFEGVYLVHELQKFPGVSIS